VRNRGGAEQTPRLRAHLAMATPRFGLGFRTQYADVIARAPRSVDWLELVSDHFLGVGGPRRTLLERLCRDHPVALHGVGLGIADSDPLDPAYLEGLRDLVARCNPVYVSDHLCWTALAGRQSHDLLPIAYTREVLTHVAERVARVQDRIGCPLLLENATAYVSFRASEIEEAEFLAELCRLTGCGVLLDVNNLYVNAMNLGTDPARALEVLPEPSVGYLHLAGHAVLPDVRIDTHADFIPTAVWQLFAAVAQRFPRADVILERDDDFPPYEQLVCELEEARKRHAEATTASQRAVAPAVIEVRPAVATGRDWSSLQHAFWQRAIAPPEGASSVDTDSLFDEDCPVPAERGARVYSEGYLSKLRAALATNFPSLARVLGGEDWVRLATDYVRVHPPRGHGFEGIGAALADFLRDYRFSADHGVPQSVFAEIAQLEQAQLESQNAPDPQFTVAVSELAAVDPDVWGDARIAFAPSVRVMRAAHDVATVVRAVNRGLSPERPCAVEQTYWVARRGDGVETLALVPGDGALAQALFAGRSFGAACAAAREVSGADEADAVERGATWLVNACHQGWVAAIEVGAS
jgi:uncharacterized protein (UPF0276 family)